MAPEVTTRIAAVGTLGLAAAGLTYVGLVDPHRPGSLFPPCPFHLLTGWYCPGCGGLRMTHDLLHADLPAAATDNLFLLVGLPLMLLWWLSRRRIGRPAFTPVALVIAAVSTVAWTVIRNLPGFPLVPSLLGS